MEIIRNFYPIPTEEDEEPKDGIHTIQTKSYGRSVAFINLLAAAACEDYPDLKDEDIKVEVLDGPRNKGITCIRFQVPGVTTTPKGYMEWSWLEETITF